jgi:hypothetical protein
VRSVKSVVIHPHYFFTYSSQKKLAKPVRARESGCRITDFTDSTDSTREDRVDVCPIAVHRGSFSGVPKAGSWNPDCCLANHSP